jgi:hypothetical protein
MLDSFGAQAGNPAANRATVLSAGSLLYSTTKETPRFRWQERTSKSLAVSVTRLVKKSAGRAFCFMSGLQNNARGVIIETRHSKTQPAS